MTKLDEENQETDILEIDPEDIQEEIDTESITIPDELPILPIRQIFVYPRIIFPLVISLKKTVRLVTEASENNKMVAIVALKSSSDDPKVGDLYSVGTAVSILKVSKMSDNRLNLMVQGVSRVKIGQYTQIEPYYRAQVTPIQEILPKDTEVEAYILNIRSMLHQLIELSSYLPQELEVMALNLEDPDRLADLVAANLNLSVEQKQELLEIANIKERLNKVTIYLNNEIQMLELRNKIQSQVSDEMNRSQREYFLREQMKKIQKELGESDESTAEIDELREEIEKAKMPEEARKEADRELGRLSRMPQASAEYTVSRTYLEWLTEMPWAVSTEDKLDIPQAEKVLDDDHYGLDKVKKRVLEYLAVRKLKSDMKGPILCFVGPPGVGKTSLGKSIARALGREFIRISLGGVRDEAEIRGHRRTYIGALPGRIIQGIKRAGSNNPVFMLDEIDKIGTDFRGDPSSALLEVLDPEQNNSFSDHYLDVAFDLSKVMFITTANVLSTIPPALRDRMEVLDFSGYTEEEKRMIAKEFLIPKQLDDHGLQESHLQFEDEALRGIIADYTREAGVRNLEREIGSICRGVARKVAEGKDEQMVVMKRDALHDYLGPVKFFSEVAQRTSETGVATGLVWTPVGGDILFVESTIMKGKKDLTLTGQLGDVMKESAQAALSYIRSKAAKLDVDEDFFDLQDIHVHVPSGAIPKDGPSAGVTLTTSLVSLLTGKPTRNDVAMTGEITLRGKVLPVGGIKEKVMGARRAGIKTVIMPKRNEKDLEDIPDEVRAEMRFEFVESIDEVLNLALRDEIDGE